MGRPCRASGLWARANPGFGRPCRASGLWTRVNPNGCASPYRGDPFQSPGCVALQGRPNPGNPNRGASTNGRASPYRGDPSPEPRGRSPPRATKPWVSQPPCKEALQGRHNPQPPRKPQRLHKLQRGDPFQSPGCVALQGRPNPGLVSPPGKEALQGRPPKRPWCASWRPLWGRRPFALLEGRACRYVDRYSSAVPHSAQPRGRQGAPPSF